jgi:hypothetical protein
MVIAKSEYAIHVETFWRLGRTIKQVETFTKFMQQG